MFHFLTIQNSITPFSDEAFSRAQAWVDDQLLTPLAATDRRRVIMARLRGLSTPQIGCFDVQFDDRSARIVLLGALVYVVEAGQPWAFMLNAASQRKTTAPALWQAYLKHRENPTAKAAPAPWPLHGQDRGSQKLLGQWRDLERDALFAKSKTKASLEARFDDHLIEGSSPDIGFYSHQKALSAALRQMRMALPRPIRAALWHYKHRDGALAHWLMAGESGTPRTYRIQALHQQPLLLPMALEATRQWPTNHDSHQDPGALAAELAQGQALTRAIERGDAWATHLPDILNVKPDPNRAHADMVRDSQHLFSCDRSGHGPGQLTCAHVKHLGGQPPGQALTSSIFRGFRGAHHWFFFAIASSFTLSEGRRPKTKAAWEQLLEIERRCTVWRKIQKIQGRQNIDAPHVPLSDAFFKGLPEDLTDPTYHRLLSRWPLLTDVWEWMTYPDDLENRLLAAVDRLSWQQWNHFVDRAHALDEVMKPRASRPPKHTQLRWNPLRPAGTWLASDGQTSVVELVCEWDLMDEGEAMRHCVADYTVDCAMGSSRVFSVRNAQGQRLSTLELIWDDDPADPFKVTVAQHFACKNFEAPVLVHAVVAEFLKSYRDFTPGPWRATVAGQERRRTERDAPDLSHRPALRDRLWAELERRYPDRRVAEGLRTKTAH